MRSYLGRKQEPSHWNQDLILPGGNSGYMTMDAPDLFHQSFSNVSSTDKDPIPNNMRLCHRSKFGPMDLWSEVNIATLVSTEEAESAELSKQPHVWRPLGMEHSDFLANS